MYALFCNITNLLLFIAMQKLGTSYITLPDFRTAESVLLFNVKRYFALHRANKHYAHSKNSPKTAFGKHFFCFTLNM